MKHYDLELSGLNPQQVETSRAIHGENKIESKNPSPFLSYVKNSVKEPMLLLLVAASSIYFIHGEFAEGIFLVLAIVLISSISLYQESRSRNALEALKSLTQPKSKVVRQNEVLNLPGEEIVVGDYIIVEEGELVPADGMILKANDFGVNESILTGESLPVPKDTSEGNNMVYQGTNVVSGLAICKVILVGNQTKVGQIGKSLQELREEKSPLQIQINDFVKKMALAGSIIFIVIWIINYMQSKLILESLLKALTLAMSILPEEIPVAFATFMALGAWRLMQLGIIVKQTKTIETLGSATVICIDKTGTITKNEMVLTRVYVHQKEQIFNISDTAEITDVITTAMWASEPIPFDPMEKAIHHAYATNSQDLRPFFKLVHEYPLGGKPPMMTHIFENKAGQRIIAAKGAPEALLLISGLTENQKQAIMQSFNALAAEGYRVLGVAEGILPHDHYPQTQQEFRFLFKGLVAFYDPPKENIKEVLNAFYKAEIVVKIITGDNVATTTTIARQINFKGTDKSITGESLMTQSPEEFSATVKNTNIFSRMFPEAKLKIIQALKQQNEIVAMTGDGVNDGPALKAAHIGIAMGRKGSEVAKQAASLILVDDDLSRMVDAIAMGRKIYNNLKKAIQYIISIHIPLILIVFIPLVLGWVYPAIFTPVHIIFLELIMGPTCSIIYENEPLEQNLMNKRPRKFTSTFFDLREITTSLVQGVMITAGLITVYWYAVGIAANLQTTTAMVFVTLITSNIMLTLVNRSFYFSILTTLKYNNKLIPLIISLTIGLMITIFTLPSLRAFFGFDNLQPNQIAISMMTGILSVIWFEVYKWIKRNFHLKKGISKPETTMQ